MVSSEVAVLLFQIGGISFLVGVLFMIILNRFYQKRIGDFRDFENNPSPRSSDEVLHEFLIDHAVVVANFKKWKEALFNPDPKVISELYSKRVSFLGTLSPLFNIGRDNTEVYFEKFLKRKPDAEIVEEHYRVLSPHCYVHDGHYNFELNDLSHRKIVEARFTFVWERKKNGTWRIVTHHSSLRPL